MDERTADRNVGTCPVTWRVIRVGPPHTEPTQSRMFAGVMGLAVLCLSGCTTDGPRPTLTTTDGDCVGRVRFGGVIYRPNQGPNKLAHRGRVLGHGAVVDCLGKAIDHVNVYAVQGVVPAKAFIARGGG